MRLVAKDHCVLVLRLASVWERVRRTVQATCQPLVEFKSVFPHRKKNFVFTRLIDVQKNFVGLAAVLCFGALHAVPAPRPLALSPLHSLPAVWPLAINTDVQAIVF